MAFRALPKLNGYDIRERIGRGAGASITLARQDATGRLVAIKHVVAREPGDEKFLDQAENEFEVAHNLEHQYLRRCYDIVRVRRWLKVRQIYLVMEYVDGVRLEDKPPTGLVERVNAFRKVAEGLHAMHLSGFAHADIKPNNILLTTDGGVKIIDFGQSCPLGHVKERVQGTPDYIAPEQVYRAPIDQRTDVYNLGASMYWVFTGKWFKTLIAGGAQPGARKIAIEGQRGSDPPHEVNPDVPVPLSRLIMECCESSRQQRPRDMRDLINRLDTVLHVVQRAARRPQAATERPRPVDARPPAEDDAAA